jgi:6-phosphofructokinase
MTPATRGNLLLGQSGGPTAVINASLVGALNEARRYEQIEHTFGSCYGIKGVLDDDLLDLQLLPDSVWQTLLRTPSAALGSSRYRLQPGDAQRIAQILRQRNIRYFLYIGGNDSADTAHQIALAAVEIGYDLRVLCIPKTIDNDLPHTDHCPGYGSAARFVAMATMDSALCTEAMPDHYPVKIIEIMGRNAGWLVGATTLGKEDPEDAPHLVYLPERPFDVDHFLAQVQEIHRQIGFVIVVIAETIRDAQQQPVGSAGARGQDAFGHPLISGAAQYLTRLVQQELGLRSRFDKPGDFQRMSSALVSTTDRDEAYLVGRMGVRYALRGATDRMVTLVRRPGPRYACETGLADLASVANTQRLLPDAFIDPAGAGMTEAFRAYALPLVGEPLPRYPRLLRMRTPPRGALYMGDDTVREDPV